MKTLSQFLIIIAIFSFIGLSLATFKNGGHDMVLAFLYAFIGSTVIAFLTDMVSQKSKSHEN